MEIDKCTRKRNKTGTLFMFLLFSLFILPSAFSSVQWEDTTQLYRIEINISGATSNLDKLTYNLILNSSNLGSEFNFSTHRNSTRFYYYNETSDNKTLIYHYAKTWSESNNNATIKIKIPYITSTQNASIWMYYGDEAKNNSEDYCSVFIYCDLFGGSTINSSLSTVDNTGYAGTDFDQSGGTLTITGGGRDTWTGQDEYASVFLPNVSGPIDARVTVVSQSNPNAWAKAGIMIKNDMTAAGSSTGYTFTVRTPGNGYSFQRDETNNGFLNANTNAGAPSISPSHVRLIKSGTSHSGYYSKTTQEEWTLINTRTITTTNNNQDIGLSMTSHAGATLGTAEFDNFTIRRHTTDTFTEVFGTTEKLANQIYVTNQIPSELIISNILQNSTFIVNMTVSCLGIDPSLNCENITGILKYNNSGIYDNISTSSSTPLWIVSGTNLQNFTIQYNNSVNFVWTLNATGNPNTIQNIKASLYSSNEDIQPINSSISTIRIIVGNSVNFNQSIYSFEPFEKGNGNSITNLKVISENGNNTNIQVNCVSGDCGRITTNWTGGISLEHLETEDIYFECSDGLSGNYSALYNITSNEFNSFSSLNLTCTINPVFGPINGILNIPNPLSTTFVGQNQTFRINATANCTGICENITAYALYERDDWFNNSWFYRKKLNISVNSAISTEYQILLKFNETQLGNNFNWNYSCNDIRFFNNTNELSYWVETCNTSSKLLSVWIKTDTAMSASSNYIIDMYYNNPYGQSKSNATETFREDEIFLVTGRYLNAAPVNSQYIDNHIGANNLRSTIGINGFTVDGISYVNQVNHNVNIHGLDDEYYSRYRFLFIPEITRSYGFGTASDDGSEVGTWNYDGYGTGIRTPTSQTSGIIEVLAHWYGAHATGTCGASGTPGSKSLEAGKGYWMDYLMNEWAGGQDAEMCINDGSGFATASITNFPGQIFSRNYVDNEPELTSINNEESIIISTNSTTLPFYTINSQPQTCTVSEDGSCNFEWIVNATGPINSEWNVSVVFFSSIESIIKNLTQYATINISDNIIPNIILYEPLNNSKLFGDGNTTFIWRIEDDDSFINATLFLNGIANQTTLCESYQNCSINLQLESGLYNWSISVNDSSGNYVLSETYDFTIILNYNTKIIKKIRSINTDLFKIDLIIENRANNSQEKKPIDFISSRFNSGSFTQIYNWIYSIIGKYTGNVIGWNITSSPNSNYSINYSITNNQPSYFLLEEFIIGLD